MNAITIHLVKKGSPIPYHLLLLADETKEAIDRYIHDSDIYLAFRGEREVGVYAIQMRDEENAEIMNIAVVPEYQNQGIGKSLLLDAEAKAKEKGVRFLFIATADGGIKQLYIYQKAGYEIVDIRKNFCLLNYPEPIFENGIQLKHMLVLRKQLI